MLRRLPSGRTRKSLRTFLCLAFQEASSCEPTLVWESLCYLCLQLAGHICLCAVCHSLGVHVHTLYSFIMRLYLITQVYHLSLCPKNGRCKPHRDPPITKCLVSIYDIDLFFISIDNSITSCQNLILRIALWLSTSIPNYCSLAPTTARSEPLQFQNTHTQRVTCAYLSALTKGIYSNQIGF